MTESQLVCPLHSPQLDLIRWTQAGTDLDLKDWRVAPAALYMDDTNIKRHVSLVDSKSLHRHGGPHQQERHHLEVKLFHPVGVHLRDLERTDYRRLAPKIH